LLAISCSTPHLYKRQYQERAVRGLNGRARKLGHDLAERGTPGAATAAGAQ
jgi:hypothetical protein